MEPVAERATRPWLMSLGTLRSDANQIAGSEDGIEWLGVEPG